MPLQTYIPNPGYNPYAPNKAVGIHYANPDGTFIITIWEGEDKDAPNTVAVAATLPGGQNIWNDALQEFVFKKNVEDKICFEFVWDNTRGYLPVGTVVLHFLIDNIIKKYDVIIEDNPFYNKPFSSYFTSGDPPISNAAAFEVRIPTSIPAHTIGGGLVDNEEFGCLDGVTSSIQDQLDAKLTIGATLTDEEAASVLESLNVTFETGGYLRFVDADGNVFHIGMNSGEPPS